MLILYHHRTAGDRVEYVHIMGMVTAFRALGHTVEISSPPGCDTERKRPSPITNHTPAPREGALRARLKRFARNAPHVLFELAELAYNLYALLDCLRRRLRSGTPDIVYERTTSNSMTPTLLARWWKIPIVQEVNVTSSIGRLRPLALKRVTHLIERWMVRRATLFLTVSNAFKRMLRERGFPADRILVCQNAINPDLFDPQTVIPAQRPGHVPPDALVLGYVGSFVPYHRLDALIEISRRLAPRHPNLRWLLVGDGTDRPKVEQLLNRYGLRNKFWMPGAVVHEQVPAFVGAMDIAVLPHSEQFNSPMKLFEYMSMARSVVVPDVPAICEVIQDGVNGLRFRAGSTDSLTRAIQRLINDPDLRARIGSRARRDVLEKHTWAQNAARVLEHIHKPTKQRKGLS